MEIVNGSAFNRPLRWRNMASNYREELMNGRDLLQTIVDLEYLRRHASDLAKRDEYEQQLQDFRRKLWRLEKEAPEETYLARRYQRAA